MRAKLADLGVACLAVCATATPGISASTADASPLRVANVSRVTAGTGCSLHVLGETRSTPAEAAAWKQVFSDFNAKYHCKVTATWEGQFTGVPQLLNEARLAKQTVDLVAVGTYNFNLDESGSLMDLTTLVAPYKNRFPAAALQPFTVDGKLWAIPDEPETSSMFFYNATLFKKLGLTIPRTFSQLVHDGDVIKSKTKVQPIVEGGSDTWEWPMWYMATFAQTSGNKSVADTRAFLSGKQAFTTSASVHALQDLAAFSKDGLLTEAALGTDENGAVAAFVQGKAAMMFDGTWDLPTVRSANPKFTVGVFPFPLVVNKRGVVSQSNGSPSEGIGIPSFIPRADLPMASQFLEFLSTPAEANKIQSTLDPVVPTVAGVAPAKDPLSATLRADLSRTNGWLDWLWPTDVVTSVENAIEGVLFSHESASKAASSVQSELETLRSQQNYTYDFWSKWSSAQKAAVEPPFIPKIQVQG